MSPSGAPPRSRLLASLGLPTPLLLLALLVYGWLGATTVTGVGVVGEVALTWALPTPPEVLVTLDPPSPAAPAAIGPLEALQTRPTERLVLGPVTIPLAVNAYTGGAADWPARAVRAVAGVPAGAATSVFLGGLLLVLVHRFLRFHGTPAAMDAAALLLATDWCFVFYRKVLGGTEVLLHAAGLLVVWALWSRRWKGGEHGTLAIAVGVGLGLGAKVTFGATLAAYAVAAFAMRWDRAGLLPPQPVRRGVLVLIASIGLLPLGIAAAHHAGIPAEVAVASHDTVGLQLARLGAPSPSREGLANLTYFLGNPLAWFAPALGAPAIPAGSALRALGFAITVVGVALEWRRRVVSPSAALLRFLSLAVPLQVGALFLANHDLHHLAQATPALAMLVALAADRVAATSARPRSALRTALTLLLVAPHVAAGWIQLHQTDEVLDALPRSTFTEAGQSELVAMLREAGAERVVTSDYEVYGMAEIRAPEIRFVHTWAAMAAPKRDVAGVLRLAAGGHYLSLRPTAPMVYDWHPNRATVERTATTAGLVATQVARLADARGEWAALYRIEAAAP